MWQQKALARIFVSEINRAIGDGEVLDAEQLKVMITHADGRTTPLIEDKLEFGVMPQQELLVQGPRDNEVVVNEKTIGFQILETLRNELFKTVRMQLEMSNNSKIILKQHDEIRFLYAIDVDVRRIILQLCSEIPTQTSAIIALRNEAINAIQTFILDTAYNNRANFLSTICLFRAKKEEKDRKSMSQTVKLDDFGF